MMQKPDGERLAVRIFKLSWAVDNNTGGQRSAKALIHEIQAFELHFDRLFSEVSSY